LHGLKLGFEIHCCLLDLFCCPLSHNRVVAKPAIPAATVIARCFALPTGGDNSAPKLTAATATAQTIPQRQHVSAFLSREVF